MDDCVRRPFRGWTMFSAKRRSICRMLTVVFPLGGPLCLLGLLGSCGDAKTGKETTTGPQEARVMAAPVDELDAHLEFSTFIGGKRDGTLREIAFDSAGNIVVAGHGAEFVADNFPIATIIGPAANQNVLVAKFTKAGKLVWMTIIGGSGLDRGYGVVLDKADNIYVAGRTSSSDFPTTPGAYDTTFNGGTPNPVVHGPSDAYVLKLSSDGKRLLYSTYLGEQE